MTHRILREIWRRLFNLAVVLDKLAFQIITVGGAHPGETMSSAAYRAELLGMPGRVFRPLIDALWLALFRQPQHCRGAYLSAIKQAYLPPDMRQTTNTSLGGPPT